MRHNWFAINALLVIFIAVFWATPTAWWIEVRSVSVTDRFLGADIPANRILIIDRTISLPFEGNYRVEEQRLAPNGKWVTVAACVNNDVVKYRPQKELPDPVTAGWWAYGRCDAVPVLGRLEGASLRLCTWHTIRPFAVLPWLAKRTKEVCSNSYQDRVLPEAAWRIIE